MIAKCFFCSKWYHADEEHRCKEAEEICMSQHLVPPTDPVPSAQPVAPVVGQPVAPEGTKLERENTPAEKVRAALAGLSAAVAALVKAGVLSAAYGVKVTALLAAIDPYTTAIALVITLAAPNITKLFTKTSPVPSIPTVKAP